MLDETDSVIHGAKFLIDGTILRTSKPAEFQKRSYKAKNNGHGTTALILIDISGFVCWTHITHGNKNDYRIVRESKIEEAIRAIGEIKKNKIIGDLAFSGDCFINARTEGLDLRVLLKTRADVEHTIGQLKQKFKFLDCNKTTGIQVEKMIPLQMLCLRLFAFDQRVQRKSWDRFSRPEFIVVSDNIFGEDLPPPPNLEKEVRANTVVEEQRRCDC